MVIVWWSGVIMALGVGVAGRKLWFLHLPQAWCACHARLQGLLGLNHCGCFSVCSGTWAQ
jgi:hypothetical protein